MSSINNGVTAGRMSNINSTDNQNSPSVTENKNSLFSLKYGDEHKGIVLMANLLSSREAQGKSYEHVLKKNSGAL